MTLFELNNYENELIEKFSTINYFQSITTMTNEEFEYTLLQRRYISYCFTIAYDFCIDALSDIESKIIARKILREEYPDESGRETSHREDLFNDLVKIGIERTKIIQTEPSIRTEENIKETLSYILKISTGCNSELKLLTFLRFWGEILVSVEYEQYWKRLENIFKEKSVKSKFYLTHKIHDKKKTSLNDVFINATTHADRLSLHLVNCLKHANGTGISDFTEIEEKVFNLKSKFYEQFNKR